MPRSNSIRVQACRGAGDIVLPAHMIIGVQPHFKAALVHAAHDGAGFASDIGPRQQHAVEQGLQAIVLEHRGAGDFLRKALAKHAAHGAAGVIRTHRKIKGGIDAQLFEQRREPRHAFAGAPQGIHIDLQADVRALKHRATTVPRRKARRERRNRRWP